jgi:hypothetical protein
VAHTKREGAGRLLLTNIRLVYKWLPFTNTLTYTSAVVHTVTTTLPYSAVVVNNETNILTYTSVSVYTVTTTLPYSAVVVNNETSILAYSTVVLNILKTKVFFNAVCWVYILGAIVPKQVSNLLTILCKLDRFIPVKSFLLSEKKYS